MHIRPAAIAALLVAVSLGAAACGPESSEGTTTASAPTTAATAPSTEAAAPTEEPSEAPAGDPTDTGTTAPAPKKSAAGSTDDDNGRQGRSPNCKEYFKTHRVIHVDTVDKGFTKLTADVAEANCSPNGLFLNATGKIRTYSVAPTAKVTVFTSQDLVPETATVKAGTAKNGLAHVKTCAETEHIVDGSDLPEGYFCYQDVYEFTVDASGAITSLTETWSS